MDYTSVNNVMKIYVDELQSIMIMKACISNSSKLSSLDSLLKIMGELKVLKAIYSPTNLTLNGS